jgi:ATP-dependent Clp protease adaptor protein ClpS
MVKIDESTKIDSAVEEAIKEIFNGDKPWVIIVWDDPVNLMTYVTYVLMELFGYTREKAHELMMKVHTEGKAVVSTGSREEMEHDVARLHEYGLWATLQRGDQAL